MSDAVLTSFDASLDSIEEALRPFLDVPLKSLSPELSAVEKARLHSVYGYSVCSLLFSTSPIVSSGVEPLLTFSFIFSVYLRTQGVDTKDHPVRKQIVRRLPPLPAVDFVFTSIRPPAGPHQAIFPED